MPFPFSLRPSSQFPLEASSLFLVRSLPQECKGVVTNKPADNLETALKMYERAKNGGIDRAAMNIRNVGAKILAKAEAAGMASR
jgi:hypothetical protein